MPSNHLILCHPLLLLPSIFPSIRVFSNELFLCIRWPKCWSFSISPSNEYSGLISFRIEWFDLLTVQGTLKSKCKIDELKNGILFSWSLKLLQTATAAMELRHLLIGRKAITNLDSVLQSRDITLPTKFRIVKTMVFPIVMNGCESWITEELMLLNCGAGEYSWESFGLQGDQSSLS